MQRRFIPLWIAICLLMALLGIPAAASPVTQIVTVDTTFLFDARADLETLANLVLGEGARPETWTFNADINSDSFVVDLWFDNEQLADDVFGVNTRPSAWLGAAGSTRDTIARNVRHDLELTADQSVGVNVRPPNWRGTTELLRCTRTLQNVLSILTTVYSAQTTTPQSVVNYCETVRGEIEDELVEAVYTADELAQLPARFLAIRGDLERLADERLGLNNRPGGWIGNRDANSPTLVGDIFLDLETLASALLGQGNRPADWTGGISNTPAISFQNLRRDLELLADETLIGERPFGWQGVDPLLRCEPLVQNLVYLTEQTYNFSASSVDVAAPDYCDQVELAANLLAENPPVLDVVAAEGDDRLTAESNYAFSYLDYAATQYMGIMPAGTQFRAWYRLFAGSDMMFVSGDNFALYLDHRFTTLPTTTFDSLPTIEGHSPITFCDASWCNGPGPTPTPTGFGALNEVLLEATPATQAPSMTVVTPGAPVVTDKAQVSWNNIRVTYVQDFPDRRVAQVALEICRQPAAQATACEPVLGVTDLVTQQGQQPISQYNGLSVFEFRYGYTSNQLIEGATTYSNDIWISDPTIR